jgi:hypothetical protein
VLRTRKCLLDLVRLVRALRYLQQVAPWDYALLQSTVCVMCSVNLGQQIRLPGTVRDAAVTNW